MVIAILMVIVGAVAMVGLPVAQYPNIVPPQIQVRTNYTGADAVTVEQSVATPIEQQMSSVEKMLYVQSTNANDGTLLLQVTFDVDSNIDIDQVNTQNKVAQAQPFLPADEFGHIVVRLNPDGSTVRLGDVARIELGALTYTQIGRYNGKPSLVFGVFQTPGSNALAVAGGVKAKMEELKKRFPPDLDYAISLDTTAPVTEGIREILITLLETTLLVALVVFLFLQSWRATLIPLIAVPVSLVGTFALFPMLGFSINSLSLFGLVLAIGLVVDDAIVVVEAVERHIEDGLSPKDATLAAMKEVTAPVVSVAVILAAVFIPLAFTGGITGLLNKQFALTIAVSVLISAFNALTLSPALSALLLRPRQEATGVLARFFAGFNHWFGRANSGYVKASRFLVRKAVLGVAILVGFTALAGLAGKKVPGGFIPGEDQGYFFLNVQLPDASSLERTAAVCRKIDAILAATPEVASYNTIAGFSLLSYSSATYGGFYFVSLKKWSERGGK